MNREFSRSLVTEKSADAVIHEALQTLTRSLNRWGYRLTTQTSAALTYDRTYRPWYVWVIGLALTPMLIGVALLILWTETETITILVDDREGGTAVLVQGEGPSKVRDAFARMEL